MNSFLAAFASFLAYASSPFRLFLGFDVFISYAWRDGRKYAEQLKAELSSRGYRCFLDNSEMVGGTNLTLRIKSALLRSSSLVVVATRGAFESKHVLSELRIFNRPQRHLVPVFLEPDLREVAVGEAAEVLQARVWIDDEEGARLGGPLPDVVEKLVRTFKFVRATWLRLVAVLAIAALFGIVALLASIQLYKVETARRLTEAQLLSRRQPSEALLILSETKSRWFVDRSVLPELEPSLLEASLTRHRQNVGDAVYDVAWTLNGGYAAASADGAAHLWDESGGKEVMLRQQVDDASANGVSPLSKITYSEHLNSVVTVDWTKCLRLHALEGSTKLPPGCINGAEPGTRSGIFAMDSVGDLAFEAAGKIMIIGEKPTSLTLPHEEGELQKIVMRNDNSVWAKYSNGSLVKIPSEEGEIVKFEGIADVGPCVSDSIWTISKSGNYILNGEELSAVDLIGEAPYFLSNTCKYYLDAGGNLYSLEKNPTLIKSSLAPDWTSGYLQSVAFSFDDVRLAISYNDGEIQVFDLRSGEMRRAMGHTNRVFAMKFNGDGTQLLTGSYDGTVRIFDLTDGLVHSQGKFPRANAIYSEADSNSVVVTAKNFEPDEKVGAADEFAVASLMPSGETMERKVRVDWRVGDVFFVADGDTQVVAICSEFWCPDESIIRKLRLDMKGSGSSIQIRSSSDGRLALVTVDAGSFNVFDLERSSNDPVLIVKDANAKSATFDNASDWIFALRGQEAFEIPLTANALRKLVASKINYCLSKTEREDYLQEFAIVAKWHSDACQKSIHN
ncbi:TIR domain-containing protein [Agrobacterium rhizogenes]|nr:TIR domain-containing protein [Rhizobium rhizogenes]